MNLESKGFTRPIYLTLSITRATIRMDIRMCRRTRPSLTISGGPRAKMQGLDGGNICSRSPRIRKAKVKQHDSATVIQQEYYSEDAGSLVGL